VLQTRKQWGDRDSGTPIGLEAWIVYEEIKLLFIERKGSQGFGGIWVPVISRYVVDISHIITNTTFVQIK
jgi:hypothetical protein